MARLTHCLQRPVVFFEFGPRESNPQRVRRCSTDPDPDPAAWKLEPGGWSGVEIKADMSVSRGYGSQSLCSMHVFLSTCYLRPTASTQGLALDTRLTSVCNGRTPTYPLH